MKQFDWMIFFQEKIVAFSVNKLTNQIVRYMIVLCTVSHGFEKQNFILKPFLELEKHLFFSHHMNKMSSLCCCCRFVLFRRCFFFLFFVFIKLTKHTDYVM